MRTLGLFLLTLLSPIAYFVLAVGFGAYQRFPIGHFLVSGVACLLLLWGLRQQRHLGRLAAAAAGLLITLGFAWYTLAFSTYGAGSSLETGTDLGADLASLVLPSHSGDIRPVLAPADQAAANLLVFYRGHW